jgi:hypothetical protein
LAFATSSWDIAPLPINDFNAMLLEQGYAIVFRARYREGYDKQVFMKSAEVYKLTFAPMITANTFKKGHRVRLEVSSSNFPRYDRNLNTGGNNFDESKSIVARNSVHHSDKYLLFFLGVLATLARVIPSRTVHLVQRSAAAHRWRDTAARCARSACSTR